MSRMMHRMKADAGKKILYAICTANPPTSPGMEPNKVMITIAENNDIDWSFVDGKTGFIDV